MYVCAFYPSPFSSSTVQPIRPLAVLQVSVALSSLRVLSAYSVLNPLYSISTRFTPSRCFRVAIHPYLLRMDVPRPDDGVCLLFPRRHLGCRVPARSLFSHRLPTGCSCATWISVHTFRPVCDPELVAESSIFLCVVVQLRTSDSLLRRA